MHLKKCGKDARYIQKYLGHKDVATTIAHYFHDNPDSKITELF